MLVLHTCDNLIVILFLQCRGATAGVVCFPVNISSLNDNRLLKKELSDILLSCYENIIRSDRKKFIHLR